MSTSRRSYASAAITSRSTYAYPANYAALNMQYLNLSSQFNNVMSMLSTQGSELAALLLTASKHLATIRFLTANTTHLETIIAAQNAEIVTARAELAAAKDRISANKSLHDDQHILDQTELMGTKLELDAAREALTDVEGDHQTLTYYIDKIQCEHKANMDEKAAELKDALERLHKKEHYIKDASAAQYQFELDCKYMASTPTKQLGVGSSQAAQTHRDAKVLAAQAEMLAEYGIKLSKTLLVVPAERAPTTQHTA